jgi:uncharacterized protein
MTRQDDYKISFTGLKLGTHSFSFRVGDGFFEAIHDAEITAGDVLVEVTMLKEERLMDLHIKISGKVRVACDRCNEQIGVTVSGPERLIVKLGDRFEEESEDVQVIPETSHFIDLGPFLYEYIHLLLPARRVHPDDRDGNSGCNPEVLKKLEELTPHHTQDPRWDPLNNLKNIIKS